MRGLWNAICRALMLPLLVLPMQRAGAELIATDPAADLPRQLERLGVSPRQARERVATMNEEERATLARNIQSLPAGGNLGYEIVFAATGIIIVAGVIVLVWLLIKGSGEGAEASAR